MTIRAASNFEGRGVALAPLDPAGLEVKTPNDLILTLPGMLIDMTAGNQRGPVARAHLDLPNLLEFPGPLFWRLKALNPAISLGPQPTRPIILRTHQRQAQKQNQKSYECGFHLINKCIGSRD